MSAFFDMLWLYFKLLLLIPILWLGFTVVMLVIGGVFKVLGKVLGYIFINPLAELI